MAKSIKIRAKAKDGVATVKVLISHACAFHSGSHLQAQRQRGIDCRLGNRYF